MHLRRSFAVFIYQTFQRRFSSTMCGYRTITSCNGMNDLYKTDQKLRVSLIGSGNWGMVVAKIIGNNLLAKDDRYERRLQMYVRSERVEGRDLAETINRERINRKYMPHCSIPDNVVASSSLEEVVEGADVLVFVLPHEYVGDVCARMAGRVKPTAVGISLCKGLVVGRSGELDFVSNIVKRSLSIDCAVLMGANLANEIALEMYSEATIGCKSEETGRLFKQLFQNSYFRIVLVEDQHTVELCGALKNIVALGAGFADGLRCGHNTKAAVVRLGLMEMISFARKFLSDVKVETFFESCGIADLVTTCYSGRNRRVAEAFALDPTVSLEELEKRMLCGQKLQGPPTAAEVNAILRRENEEHKFPMLTAVHRICSGEERPDFILKCLKDHPEHMDDA